MKLRGWKMPAMRGRIVRVANPGGSARNWSTSSALMYSPSTHWKAHRPAGRLPGQRICLTCRPRSDFDGGTPTAAAHSKPNLSVASFMYLVMRKWSASTAALLTPATRFGK